MKFNCGLPLCERNAVRREAIIGEIEQAGQWHDYFAIWPKRVGNKDCRFLEAVERRMVDCATGYDLHGNYGFIWIKWAYRAKPAATATNNSP